MTSNSEPPKAFLADTHISIRIHPPLHMRYDQVHQNLYTNMYKHVHYNLSSLPVIDLSCRFVLPAVANFVTLPSLPIILHSKSSWLRLCTSLLPPCDHRSAVGLRFWLLISKINKLQYTHSDVRRTLSTQLQGRNFVFWTVHSSP